MFQYIAANPGYILEKAWEHFYLFIISWAIAVVVGIAIGIFVTRPGRKRIGQAILSVMGAAQSVPSIAIIALVFILLGIGGTPAIVALFLYSLVPIIFNSASGLLSVDPAMLEAARGMGMTKRQILFKIEMPVSIAPIASGMRSAATINIGTATIASAIGAGGLGEMIFIGLRLMNNNMILTGALFSALMAIIVDTVLAGVESSVTSEGMKLRENYF
ncbi:MAG: ABC transporter permease [Spirochaetia bacterium]